MLIPRPHLIFSARLIRHKSQIDKKSMKVQLTPLVVVSFDYFLSIIEQTSPFYIPVVRFDQNVALPKDYFNQSAGTTTGVDYMNIALR